VNVACGFHAGDPQVMDRTVGLAARAGVAVGAHPGYPDLRGFGRRPLDASPAEVEADVLYQVGALAVFAQAHGLRLRHVKPHGALYNQAERDAAVARTILLGIQASAGGSDLLVFAPPGSAMHTEAQGMGMRVAREGFIDRAYEPDGTLRPRTLAGALITDPAAAAAQALSFVRDGGVRATDGKLLKLEVDTLCIHGDTPGAPDIVRAVREAFAKAKVKVAPFRA